MRLLTIGTLEAELEDYQEWHENAIQHLPLDFLWRLDTLLFIWLSALGHHWRLLAFQIR